MPYKDIEKKRAYQNAWLKARKKTWTEAQWEKRRGWNRAFYQRSVAKGLCGCGNERKGHFGRCASCLERDGRWKAGLRVKRMESGLCVDCGISLDFPGSSMRRCMNCNEKQRNRAFFRRGY